MHRLTGSVRAFLVAIALTLFSPTIAAAHPGTGIVVDRQGNVYVVDMVSGVWKLDSHGDLIHIAGPAFHWMALDAGNRLGATPLPSGSAGEVERLRDVPSLLLASDYPIAIGADGTLYYPSHTVGQPLQLLKRLPSGAESVVTGIQSTSVRGALRYLNGLAVAPDGSLYYTESDAIRRVGKDGRVSTVVANIVVPGCAGRDPLLQGLDIDAAGTVYVAATGCGNVITVSSAGRVTVLAQVTSPWPPTGVVLSGKGVYVLEFQNADTDDRREMLPRIRKIMADGKTAVAGTVVRH